MSWKIEDGSGVTFAMIVMIGLALILAAALFGCATPQPTEYQKRQMSIDRAKRYIDQHLEVIGENNRIHNDCGRTW